MNKSPSSRAGRGGVSLAARGRSSARLAAVQALYQVDVTGAPLDGVLRDILQSRVGGLALADDPDQEREIPVPLIEANAELLTSLVRGTVERREDIDRMIDGALSAEWSAERLELVVRQILRAGTFELLERSDIPMRVVISEYVDVAHAFYGGPEPKLVNAVLDRLARLLRPGETTERRPEHDPPQ